MSERNLDPWLEVERLQARIAELEAELGGLRLLGG